MISRYPKRTSGIARRGSCIWNSTAQVPCQKNVVRQSRKKLVLTRLKPFTASTYPPYQRKTAETTAGKTEYISLLAPPRGWSVGGSLTGGRERSRIRLPG